MNENNEVKMAVMAEKLDQIGKTIDSINAKLEKNYVSIDKLALLERRIGLVEKIVYTVTAILGASFIYALASFFIPKH
jgi:hypothetical protein